MSLTIEVSEKKKYKKKVKIEIYIDTREPLTKPQWNFERLRNGDNRVKGKGYSDCQFVRGDCIDTWSLLSTDISILIGSTNEYEYECLNEYSDDSSRYENKSQATGSMEISFLWDSWLLKLIDRWIFIEWLI